MIGTSERLLERRDVRYEDRGSLGSLSADPEVGSPRLGHPERQEMLAR
jgi:hypothetical protein